MTFVLLHHQRPLQSDLGSVPLETNAEGRTECQLSQVANMESFLLEASNGVLNKLFSGDVRDLRML